MKNSTMNDVPGAIKGYPWLALMLFMMPVAVSFAAYKPPIGIPAPSFGTEEVAPAWPAGWPSSEVPGYYYIDNTNPAATDTGNTYGYPDRPRSTLPNHATYPAGTVIEVHGGPYPATTYMTFQCTVAAPCWLRGSSAATRPTFTGLFNITNSHYLIIENVDFNGGASGAMSFYGMDTSFIAVRDSIFQNRAYVHHTTAIGTVPDLGGTLHDIVVLRNSFHDLGDWTVTVDQDFHGVAPSLWGRDPTTSEYNFWILENEFYHLSGNGVQVNAGTWPNSGNYLHHIYIGKNIGHHNRQAAFWSKQARDVIMSQNVAYGGRLQHVSGAPGDGIGFQYGPDNLWIIFNEIYDSDHGIRQSDTTAPAPPEPLHKAYIVGNVIHDINHQALTNASSGTYDPNFPWRQGTAITFWSGSMERYVVDNTIYNVDSGINDVQTGPLTISGNLVVTKDNATQLTGFLSARNNLITASRNLFFSPVLSDAHLRWDGADYTTLAAFQAAVGQCMDCRFADPGFVGTGPVIGQTSPAVDAGLPSGHSVYDDFFNRYGIDIRKDFLGNPRPRGKAWDIGAIEYQFLPPLNPPVLKLSWCM